MANILVNGDGGSNGSTVVAGQCQVVASGEFAGNICQVDVTADFGDYVPAYTFYGPGVISLQTTNLTGVRASITGVNSSSITVSVTE